VLWQIDTTHPPEWLRMFPCRVFDGVVGTTSLGTPAIALACWRLGLRGRRSREASPSPHREPHCVRGCLGALCVTRWSGTG